jgi:hypothetical protein
MATAAMNPDFADLLRAFCAARVRSIVVGAYALAFHSRPRATGDMDIWVEPTPENARSVLQALRIFGAPLDEVDARDFETPGVVFQIGVPPRRIDLLTDLTGLTFAEAWDDRITTEMLGIKIDFLGRASLIKNKRALGRLKDLADIEMLEG